MGTINWKPKVFVFERHNVPASKHLIQRMLYLKPFSHSHSIYFSNLLNIIFSQSDEPLIILNLLSGTSTNTLLVFHFYFIKKWRPWAATMLISFLPSSAWINNFLLRFPSHVVCVFREALTFFRCIGLFTCCSHSSSYELMPEDHILW